MKKVLFSLAAMLFAGAMFAQSPEDKAAAKAAAAAKKAAEKEAAAQLTQGMKLRDEVMAMYQANLAENTKEKTKPGTGNLDLVAKNEASIKLKGVEAMALLEKAEQSGNVNEKKFYDLYKAMDDVAAQVLNPELQLAAAKQPFDTLAFANSVDAVCKGCYGILTYGKPKDELQKPVVAAADLKMPKLHVYYAYLCMFYLETKNLDGACAAFDKYKGFATKYPKVANDPAIQQPQNPYSQFAFNIYYIAYTLNKFDVCEKYYDEALQFEDEQSHAFVVSSRPQMLLQKGDTVAWTNELKKMIDADPNSPNAEVATQNLLAHYNKKGVNEMGAFADEMLAKNPDNKMANYGKGYSLLIQNKYEEAVKYFEKSVEIDPEYMDGNFQVGFCYYQIGLENGRKIADKKYASQAAADKDAEAKVKSYLRKAAPYFEKVRELKPEDPNRWAGELKVIYSNLGQKDKLKDLPNVGL